MAFKTEIGQHFPPEAYAYVGDPEKPETWAFRIWESVSQKVTGAQVSRAVAALSATRRGRKLSVPESMLAAVKAKLLAAWESAQGDRPVPMVLKTFASAVGDINQFAMRSGGLPPLVKTPEGDYAVLGLPIFKTGTFRDSTGVQHQIDSAYLNDAANNFYALKDSGVLPSVPWRLNHSRDVKDVVGYFENAYVDESGEFLLCDFAFTDEKAATQYGQGKFRNRSIEIGAHTTNAEETYDPVIMGCAFVDLPAVEGLYNHPADGSQFFPFEEITEMPTFTINGVPTTDEKAVQDYIATLEAKTPAVHSFTIAGQAVTDVAAVQTQLDRIPQFEAFLQDAKAGARKSAVEAAIKDNKISAAQKDDITLFVGSLNDDQFKAWQATMEKTPAIPAFGTHMGGGNGDDRNPADQNGVPNVIEDAKAMVAMHKAAKMSRDVLEQTASYKTLVAAGITVF